MLYFSESNSHVWKRTKGKWSSNLVSAREVNTQRRWIRKKLYVAQGRRPRQIELLFPDMYALCSVRWLTFQDIKRKVILCTDFKLFAEKTFIIFVAWDDFIGCFSPSSNGFEIKTFITSRVQVESQHDMRVNINKVRRCAADSKRRVPLGKLSFKWSIIFDNGFWSAMNSICQPWLHCFLIWSIWGEYTQCPMLYLGTVFHSNMTIVGV